MALMLEIDMNIKDFKEGFQINKEFLDTIDFVPFLKETELLSVLMTAVKIFVFSNHKEIPPELHGEVFNYYNEEDFKDYLEKRYKDEVNFYPLEDYVIGFREDYKNDY